MKNSEKESRKILHIYLFRHGQTTFNRDKRFTGWLDAKLTPLGIKHARIIAQKLKNKKFEIAFYTDLSRSKDTLKEVLKFHPECGKLVKDNRMIERNYGKLNGKYHYEIVKNYGQEKFDKWHRGLYERPPKGESFADVEKRVKLFVKDLFKMMRKEKASVAISSHGNSIRLFRKIMEKATRSETCRWIIPYDKVFEYKINV